MAQDELGINPVEREDAENLHGSSFVPGLEKGLSMFSGPSRVALILGLADGDPLRVYDRHDLLSESRAEIRSFYDSSRWNELAVTRTDRGFLGRALGSAEVTALTSAGYSATSLYYQMWFTEHHANVVCHGPTERWLQHAAEILAHHAMWGKVTWGDAETLGHAIEWYTPRAVEDHLRSALSSTLGRNTGLPVHDILDGVAGISNTLEEGRHATGRMAFVDPSLVDELDFLTRFPLASAPSLGNWKHVRKLLTAVEFSEYSLASDGDRIVGICHHCSAASAILAHFRKGKGQLVYAGEPVCRISEGRFYAATRGPDWSALKPALSEISAEAVEKEERLRSVVINLANAAVEHGHGCTLVVDPEAEARNFAGQLLEGPLNLRDTTMQEMVRSMSQVDGALLIDSNGFLHGFACILDGQSLQTEDRSRGARFNSALRFAEANPRAVLLVVSEDGHVSVFHEGRHLTEQPTYPRVQELDAEPPTIQEWLSR